MDKKRKIEDEIKFKELLKNPLRLFGWVFLYFFLLLVVLGIYFGDQITNISFNEQEVGLSKKENLKQEIIEQKGEVTAAVDIESIKTPTQKMIDHGENLYNANCQSCHGTSGLGDGPAGIALNPKARNLQSKDGWTNGRTIDQLYKTLQEGIVQNGMAAYEYLTPSDRLDIIHFIRTFASFPEISEVQIERINEQYNLSEGVVKSDKIPVKKAIDISVENSKSLNQKIVSIKSEIEYLKDVNSGASKLINYTSNINKVIISFLQGNTISFDNFVESVTDAPISVGFKPSVNQLSKEELKQIFDVLNQAAIR